MVLLAKLTTKIFETMKNITIILMMIGIQIAAGQPNSSRRMLAEITGGESKTSADSLVDALQSRSMDRVRVTMNELVKQNKSHLVCIALTDASDEVKIEAAKALSSVKKKSIASGTSECF